MTKCAICESECIGPNGGDYPLCIACVDNERVYTKNELMDTIRYYTQKRTGEERKYLDYLIVFLETGEELGVNE